MDAERWVLDPKDLSNVSGVWNPDRPIRTDVRTFGHFPDLSSLKPGDLILTQDSEADFISKKIASAQIEAGFPAEDACWTHAAMYVGDNEKLVEANFDLILYVIPKSQIRVVSIEEYVGKHVILFRRPKGLTDLQRWLLVIEAVSRVNQSYDFRFLWDTLVKVYLGYSRDSVQRKNPFKIYRDRTTRVCSTLYAYAYTVVTKKTISGKNDQPLPAELSMSSEFDDIRCSWLKIG